MNRKSKLGLLFKQYYDDPAQVSVDNGMSEYSIDRLRLLPSDSLMSKTVESLRMYKEAESELRMLLYNNCDKLLEAVQVVVDVRIGSGDLVDKAMGLVQTSEGLVADRSCAKTPMSEFQRSLSEVLFLAKLEEYVLNFPTALKTSASLGDYLCVRREIFEPYSKQFGKISHVYVECAKIIDEQVVPSLLAGDRDAHTIKLLLELYPEGHSLHVEIISQYIEVEIEAFRNRPRDMTVETAIETFSNLVSTLFLGDVFSVNGQVIIQELLPEASGQIVRAMRGIVTDVASLAETAGLAHLRVPGIDFQYVNDFKRACLLAWIDGCLVRAGENVILEDLPPLFKAQAFGACCDAIHTRFCAVIVEVYTCAPPEFRSCVPEIIPLVAAYYERVLLPRVCGDVGLEWLLSVLRMNQTVRVRGTVHRSVSSLLEIFDFDDEYEEVAHLECEGLVLMLIGDWVGTDLEKFDLAVTQLGSVFVHNEPTAVPNKRFERRRASTVDLEMAETLHSRKLMFSIPTNFTAEYANFVVACIFLRTLKEANERMPKARMETLFQDSEYMGTIAAMLSDL